MEDLVEAESEAMDEEENDVVLEEEDDVAEDEAVDDEAEADDEPEPAAASAPPSDDGAAKSDPPSEAPPAKELPPADMACPEGHVLKKQSGYLFYSAQFRASCKARVDEENADAAAGARSQMVMKALAAGWSALDDATKKKYGDDAPWEAKKIKEKKPTKKEKAKAAAAADAKKGWETMENALDVQALRDLKMLYDEGVLTAVEFAAKKAMVLGTPPAAAASSNGAGPSSSTAPPERGTRLRLVSRPLPNDVVWHILSFWRTTRDDGDDIESRIEDFIEDYDVDSDDGSSSDDDQFVPVDQWPAAFSDHYMPFNPQ